MTLDILNTDAPRTEQPNTLLSKMIFIVVGLPLAGLFAWIDVLRYPAWLLSSIFHEAGHTFYALFVGCPALPALRLDGHAATVHGDQIIWITFIVWAGLAYLAWFLWWTGTAFFQLGGVLLLIAYPLLAYHESTREVAHLLSGHLGELAFAAIFFWRTTTGWFVGGAADRAANSLVAWYLVLTNAYLCYGLMYVPSVRKWYFSSGSFGLSNDYMRVANHWLHSDVGNVAWPMLLVTLAVLPLSLVAARGMNSSDR